MVIDYDPDHYATGFGFVRIVCAFHGTVLPHVLMSGLFWIVLALHAIFHVLEFCLHYRFSDAAAANSAGLISNATDGHVRTQGEFDKPRFGDVYYEWSGLKSQAPGWDGLPRVDFRVGTVSLPLCVFFLVFYVNSQHLRFMEFYTHVIGIAGCTMVWVGLVKTHLVEVVPGEHRLWNAVRYVVAAGQCFYYEINSCGDNDIDRLVRHTRVSYPLTKRDSRPVQPLTARDTCCRSLPTTRVVCAGRGRLRVGVHREARAARRT